MRSLHVFDTFATSAHGRIMHFDVIIDSQDEAQAMEAARSWLKKIGEASVEVKVKSCVFCHSVSSQQLADVVAREGYAIYKLDGCPA